MHLSGGAISSRFLMGGMCGSCVYWNWPSVADQPRRRHSFMKKSPLANEELFSKTRWPVYCREPKCSIAGRHSSQGRFVRNDLFRHRCLHPLPIFRLEELCLGQGCVNMFI